MWDFSFMTPCVLMLLTILGFYFSEPRLPVRANRTFVTLLVIELCVMATDIISTLADEYYQDLSQAILYVANTLYFMFFFARSYYFYRYTLRVVLLGSEIQQWVEAAFSAPFWFAEVLCVSSVFTGAIFRIDETGYHSGPFYPMLYVCSFLYIALSIAMLIRRRDELLRHELSGALAYNAVLLAGSTMRLLFPRVLVMDTFCTIAITIIFFCFMNPHLFIDQNHIAFNKRGLRLLLSEALERDGLRVMGIAIMNYQQERVVVGGNRVDRAIESICVWIVQSFPRNVLFYLGSGHLAMTGIGNVDWKDVQQRIRKQFQNSWEIGGSILNLGVRFVDIDETSGLNSPDKIINTMSLALEHAGQNDTTTYNANKDTLSIGEVYEQVMIMRTLERVLERHEVEVFLQPVVLGTSHELIGAEALARIRDEDGDIVPPSQFIPIAEQTGLINKLGIQVFDKVCAFIATYDLKRMGLDWVNINLSPLQCAQQDIAEHFALILEQHGIASDLIHLEVTEQSIVDYSLIKDQILQLHGMGFKFSLDDYGTGYSNLVRLSDYPFSNIKLDMSLVRSYSSGKGGLLPVAASGLKSVGYTITAEGVETEEMAKSLTGIGADYLQGYLFSRPLPIDEFVRTYGAG
ncbi:MAG: EAL domain-containing protein [Atopobiaceae bacterium]|nr:EAL domain-containing protein [Atopobiaceae bacterium]